MKDFSIRHYTVKVDYNTEGWLEKIKDPINKNLNIILTKSSDAFIGGIFVGYFGNDEDVDFINQCKKSVLKNISHKHREYLNCLMNQLFEAKADQLSHVGFSPFNSVDVERHDGNGLQVFQLVSTQQAGLVGTASSTLDYA